MKDQSLLLKMDLTSVNENNVIVAKSILKARQNLLLK